MAVTIGKRELTSGSFTGSFAGDGTLLVGVTSDSASWAETASYAEIANTLLGSIESASWAETASYAEIVTLTTDEKIYSNDQPDYNFLVLEADNFGVSANSVVLSSRADLAFVCNANASAGGTYTFEWVVDGQFGSGVSVMTLLAIDNGTRIGQLQHASGSISAPGISFMNDPDTGIYHTGTVVGLVYGADAVAFWNASGFGIAQNEYLGFDGNFDTKLYHNGTDDELFYGANATNDALVAAVVVTQSAATGDYPKGTIWAQY